MFMEKTFKEKQLSVKRK